MKESQKAVKELMLMLLYLCSWEENEVGLPYRQSWKGYDFDVLNELSEEELIYDSRRSKSVSFSEQGIEKAKSLLAEYGIDIDG